MYQHWKIHVTNKRNPCINFDKSITYLLRKREIQVTTLTNWLDDWPVHMNHSVLWLSDWQCKAMIRPGSNKNWLRLGGLPTVEPIYWRKWVFPTKKKCSGAQGRRWSIARSPLDNSCLRRTPDFSLKATVKIYHIDILLSDISSRISCKNLSLPARTLISEKYFLSLRIWIWKCLF